jgi:hypothetical protein
MKILYHIREDDCMCHTAGPHENITNTDSIWGNCTGITGSAHNITGDVSGLRGYVTGLSGIADFVLIWVPGLYIGDIATQPATEVEVL